MKYLLLDYCNTMHVKQMTSRQEYAVTVLNLTMYCKTSVKIKSYFVMQLYQ